MCVHRERERGRRNRGINKRKEKRERNVPKQVRERLISVTKYHKRPFHFRASYFITFSSSSLPIHFSIFFYLIHFSSSHIF